MSMTLISTVTVGATSQTSIVLNSIPQDGTDLLLLISARSNDPSSILVTTEAIPNNTISGAHRRLTGTGSAASSTNSTSNIGSGAINGSTSTASTFSNLSFYFHNYASSVIKPITTESVIENNATTAELALLASRIGNSSAITSIVVEAGGSGIVQHSSVSLYKITKGSVPGVVVS